MEWKGLFKSHILERGFGYYIEGSVVDIDISENNIRAQVSGSDLYDVEIEMENDEIIDMHCNCPYANDGKKCKHMAAVLFEYEELDDNNESSKSIEDMVNNADESVVRAFLTDILEDSERLYIKFKNIVSTEINQKDIKNLKEEINFIIDSYSDENDFISYRSAWDFANELIDFINDNIKIIINKGYLKESFDLIVHIFKTINYIDIDDSDGGMSVVTNECCDSIRTIISKADINLKEKLYLWLKEYIDGSLMDFYEESIEDIIIYEFNDKEFVIKNLEFTDKKLNELEKDKDEWNYQYGASLWFKRHMDLMDINGVSIDEKLEYCKKHWKLSEARKFCINEYCNIKDYGKAIDVLNESLNLDKEYVGLITEYKYKLKNIYMKIGDTEKYIDVLWNIIINGRDFKLYNELKNQYTQEEWIEKREILYSMLKNKPIIAEFYNEEKLYDRLLAYVIASRGLYEVNKYIKILSKMYPDKILEKYRYELEIMAENAADRQTYQGWVYILRQMKKIKGGNKVVEAIVEGWKDKYKRRRAMMDELDDL